METSSLKAEIQHLLDSSNEETLQSVYQLLKELEYTDEFKNILNEEYEGYQKNREALLIKQQMHLRKEVISYLETADDKVVKMVHAMLEVDAQDDWWNEIPDSVKVDIETAIQESEKGLGLSHQEVKEKYNQWFAK